MGLLATCGTLLNKIYPFLLRILASSLAETSLGSGWNMWGSGPVRSAMGRHRRLWSRVRAVFQKMAMTASADGLGVGGKRHILIRLQGPLCDFGAGAFKEARAASQGGATGELHLLHLPRSLHLPRANPRDLVLMGNPH